VNRQIALLALGIFVLADSPLAAQRGRGRESGARYGWLSSLDAGKAEARRSGKPIMVVMRCVP
jgi:hypothetical protein